jgi:hypothetical protein
MVTMPARPAKQAGRGGEMPPVATLALRTEESNGRKWETHSGQQDHGGGGRGGGIRGSWRGERAQGHEPSLGCGGRRGGFVGWQGRMGRW